MNWTSAETRRTKKYYLNKNRKPGPGFMLRLEGSYKTVCGLTHMQPQTLPKFEVNLSFKFIKQSCVSCYIRCHVLTIHTV